ncbi:DUF4012 domain-containing protein [Herbiconiux sp. UC225_62]|uniref:DUF4012 domain-containing protein n=1 Tax=Herbiconiux sp. UC225_62 TaxID=3350168 RepID=UPI0036D27B86
MTDEIPTRRSVRAEPERRRKRRRRWPWAVGGAVLLLAIAGGALWVGLQALTVKNELEAARPLLSSVKDKVLSGSAASAQAEVDRLAAHTERAREASSGPVWQLAEIIPGAGANLRAVRIVAESVDDVVQKAVVPAVGLGDALSPAVFKPVDGAVNLDAIESILPVLDQSSTSLTAAKRSVDAIDTAGLIAPVKSAVTEIQKMVDGVEPALGSAKALAPVLPSLLGADTPKNYLLVFENSAEARPLGGIAGAQILITADAGRVEIARQTSGRDFAFESEEFADSHVPREARDLYLPPFGVQSQNNTLTPRVDVAANLTRSMWQDQLGETADTVIFVDPVALSYVLEATGPILLPDGQSLSSENAVDLLLNEVYTQFPDDPDAQDAFFSVAAASTFGAIMSGSVDVPALVDAIGRGGSEQRIVASSVDPVVQELVEMAALGGRMPAEQDAAHQIGVYFSDFLGSKMDYYLRSSIAVGQQTCSDGSRRVRLTVDASNILDPNAVPDLSRFITGSDSNDFDVPLGDLRVFTYVYAPEGSSIVSIAGTTSQENSFVGTDENYPVARAVIQVAPGQMQSATIDIDVSSLTEKQIETLVSPLIVPAQSTELTFTC